MARWRDPHQGGQYDREHNDQQDWPNAHNVMDCGGHRGDRVGHGGDRVRHGGDRVRHGGDRVRHGGDRVRHGGDRVRHDGDRVRHGGDRVRHGGDRVRYGGDRGGHGGDRVRDDGDGVRHGGCGGDHDWRDGNHSGRGIGGSIGDRGGHDRGRGGRYNRGRGRENSGHGNCQARAQFLTDDQLQTLSQNGPEEVLAFASQDEYIFLNTFKRKNYCKHPMKLKQMIHLLCLLVRNKDKRFATAMLAQTLCGEGDFGIFMLAIHSLLKKMPLEHRGFIKMENVACIGHLVEVGLVAIGAVPSTVLYTYPILVLQKTMDDLRVLGENLEVEVSKFEGLHAAFEEKWKMAIEMRRKVDPICKMGEPPEPFTELPILPTLNELSMKSSQVYLRSNIVAGGYKSWEHYFDIQFRLLREDFVRPLREGIELYCMRGSSHAISAIRVYENARILNPVCLFTGMGFQVQFDASKFQNVKWEHSKRLIFGSLLCLSDDEFREHVIFATVVKRDPKLLKEGLLTIKFEDGANEFAINPLTYFKMVESTAYFEAYRYILEILQRISRNPDLMPMKSYIVDCVDYKDVLRLPAFLDLPTSPAEFDMKDILGTRKQFNVTDFTKWPLAAQTNLDDSQLEALKMALTQEFAVIQGPPGTGKTFIGLKIAETYLKNRLMWDPRRASPIFIVCYTNHALDQFLEGIQNIKGIEPNIIRIGGRSKSESLSRCLLREKVQNCRVDKSIPNSLYSRYQKARSDMIDCQKYIDLQMDNCDAQSNNKVIEISTLGGCISEHHIYQLELYQVTEEGKEIEVWLGLWFPEVHEDDQQAASFQQNEDEKEDEIGSLDLLSDVESNEEEFIEVDSEARVLQDERMIEGEDIELLGANHFHRKLPKKKTVSKPKTSQNEWSIVQPTDAKRKKLINQGFRYNPMTEQEANEVDNIWILSNKQRWMLYLYWVYHHMMQCKGRINRIACSYNQACAHYNDCQKEIDCYVAQGSDVIGMTTTGAAKYHHLLNSLRPKIVIFEEAAEVLEAHLVTSIASSVQQVILIGDHKQLRPKPTCYALEKDYNLGVSLFERLVDPKVGAASSSTDGFPYVTLEVQHRMRPEISKLIHPSIYQKIIDAPSVKKYGHVKGVSKDLYFISHTSHEEHNAQSDLKSHINKFEADYVVQLCHYLLKQGYSPDDITILTMYRGQLLELKRRMTRKDFEGVRVAAVDDFQGEENKIIILSLVRSNPEGNIGFLKIENRVCVSLSRAKEGLYIIGNGFMLKDQHCTKWPEILKYLERVNCIGRGLTLYCQNHPNDSDIMVKPEDFKKRPEGGCQVICNKRLSCGHVCPRVCHIQDAEHEFTRCTKTCNKQFNCGHLCKRKCYECKKNQTCLPCSEYVEKELPLCHHKIKAACSARVDQISCPIACSKILPDCGHKCQNTCSAPCTTRCKELLTKRLPCNHQEKVACYLDVESVLCSAKCEAMLKCGDPCEGTCGKCMQGRLHVKCTKKCGRSLMCGHTCNFPCASICPPCSKPCNNYCIHSGCPKKCYETCDPCMEQCEWKCIHLECTEPCGKICDRPPCNEPCRKLLPCSHQCIGLCGEKCPQKCRKCHRDEVCEIFFGNEDEVDALFIELQDCGHIVEVTELDKWMAIDTLKDSEVMFKSCPKCKTSIRKSMRYGNHIKQVLRDVDAIKLKQIENPSTIFTCLQTAMNEMEDLGNRSFINEDIARINKAITSAQPNNFLAAVIKFQLSLLPTILRLKNHIDDLNHQVDISGFTPHLSEELLVKLKEFLMQEFLSAQQCSDIIFEMRRLSCLIKLLDLICKIRIDSPQICRNAVSDLNEISDQIKTLHLAYSKDQKVSEEKEKEVIEFIKKLSTKYNVNGLSNEERVKIVEAIGLPKGHWYKCQNGHFYCIGECGGAMEVSKCPECKVPIGGTLHRLVDGNYHAGEMDGSRHAIWSEAANLENFDLADLARLRL